MRFRALAFLSASLFFSGTALAMGDTPPSEKKEKDYLAPLRKQIDDMESEAKSIPTKVMEQHNSAEQTAKKKKKKIRYID